MPLEWQVGTHYSQNFLKWLPVPNLYKQCSFKILLHLFIYFYGKGLEWDVYASAHIWRSEGNLQESVLFVFLVGFRNWPQDSDSKHRSKCLFPLRHFPSRLSSTLFLIRKSWLSFGILICCYITSREYVHSQLSVIIQSKVLFIPGFLEQNNVAKLAEYLLMKENNILYDPS